MCMSLRMYPLQHDVVIHVHRYMQVAGHALQLEPAHHQAALMGIEGRIQCLHLLRNIPAGICIQAMNRDSDSTSIAANRAMHAGGVLLRRQASMHAACWSMS